MNAACAERRWRADPAAQLVWRRWGEAHFAFDPRSCQTHFLNELAVESYAQLQIASLTADELYRAVLARHDIDEDDALRDALDATVMVLDRLGLIVAT
jgi:PqqD family protein of HPr-rel-A system